MANMLMQASPQESDMASEETGVEISSGSKLGDSAKLGRFSVWEQEEKIFLKNSPNYCCRQTQELVN